MLVKFRLGWNSKMNLCPLVTLFSNTQNEAIDFWMPLNLEKHLWKQLHCHYLPACLEPKTKSHPVLPNMALAQAREVCAIIRALMMCHHEAIRWGKKSMHLKNSSCSHSEHCWAQSTWKAEKLKSHPDLTNCHQLRNLTDLPSSCISNFSCPRGLKKQCFYIIASER